MAFLLQPLGMEMPRNVFGRWKNFACSEIVTQEIFYRVYCLQPGVDKNIWKNFLANSIFVDSMCFFAGSLVLHSPLG